MSISIKSSFKEPESHYWILGVLILLLAYLAYNSLRNYLFSPLANFPGPRLWAVSSIPSQLSILGGRSHQRVLELHDTYGPVVRVGPDELSFNTAGSFQDIYGIDSTRGQLAKDPKLYAVNKYGVKDSVLGYVDSQNHGRQRRLISHAFSERALLDQESIIVGHIDYFIQRLREERQLDIGSSPTSGTADIKTWFNYLTFDITGDLMFAQTYGCLEHDELHPWIALVFNTIKGITVLSVMAHFPILRAVKETFVDRLLQGSMQRHFQYSAQQADKRITMGANRADIMGYILKNGLSDKSGTYRDDKTIMSRSEIHANSFVITTAGSETTATLLSGCIFHLCQNPSSMKRLTDEIRQNFSSNQDIQARACAKLEYLNAVVKESLRLYPPVATSLPRITPAGGCVIDGHFVSENVTVSTHQYASYHSTSNFARPEEFLPARWLKKDSEFSNDNGDALQPFSLGPRNCVGKNLAYLEIRLTLAKLLFHFDVELRPESEKWIDQNVYVVWEKPSLMVKLTDRAQ